MLTESQILTLLNLPKVGRKTILKFAAILNAVEHPEAIEDVAVYNLFRMKMFDVNELDFTNAKNKATQILEQAVESKITLLGYWNAKFPASLKSISDPPVLLYVAGSVDALSSQKRVAIIGTREPSPYGLQLGQRLGEILAGEGFTVISGLAKGCDTAGHVGCLKALGRTVAVLAHGLDRIYPAENKDLAFNIIHNNGTLVTEYATGVKPFSTNFVERDRIQAGLSDAVIVIETDIKGGTMHTVKYAEEAGRLLACLSHPEKYANHDKANGNRMLIEQGRAIPIKNVSDIEKLVLAIYERLGITQPLVLAQTKLFSTAVFEIDETLIIEKPKKKKTKRAKKGEKKQYPIWE